MKQAILIIFMVQKFESSANFKKSCLHLDVIIANKCIYVEKEWNFQE